MKSLFRIKYWPLLLDIGVILLCVLFAEWQKHSILIPFSFREMLRASGAALGLLPQADSVARVAALLAIPIHALILYVFTALVNSYFIAVVYFAFAKARLKATAEKKLYATAQDLTYFRDTFPGMTPATVSLLMDLEVETKKDVSASLVQMMGKGLIVPSEEGFVPANTQKAMSASEAELMRFVSKKTANLSRWKELSMEEAVASGYLQKDGENAPGKALGILWGACFAVAAALYFFVDSVFGGGAFFERLTAGLYDMQGFAQTPAFASDALLSLLVWLLGACVVGVLALPIYAIVFDRWYKKLRAPVRRTARGEAAARQLYGIKNFIHDFSLLKEATKEKVALWDDFLVYAIVLEENKDIVNEIARYYPSMKLLELRL